jgi:CRISPR-associated protein Csb2
MTEEIAPSEGPFDSNILVLAKFEGHNLGLDATLTLTRALRNAALKAATEGHRPAPEWLSGHKPDGSASAKPHVAFFPLAFAGSEHADGHLMGLGMAVPREIHSETGQNVCTTGSDGIRRCHQRKRGRASRTILLDSSFLFSL